MERLLHPRVLAALGVVSILLAGLLGYSGWQLAHATAPLDDFGPAPTFSLTDQLGRPVGNETLRDRVVLVDFIYTRCRDTCPLLSGRMQALQDLCWPFTPSGVICQQSGRRNAGIWRWME